MPGTLNQSANVIGMLVSVESFGGGGRGGHGCLIGWVEGGRRFLSDVPWAYAKHPFGLPLAPAAASVDRRGSQACAYVRPWRGTCGGVPARDTGRRRGA